MKRIDVTLSLPQELVKEATAAGLLTEQQIEQWLMDELDRQHRLDRFFGKLDRLAALEPPLEPEEIEAEIEAYRREKRQRRQEEK